jgi:hypothetical protein
MSTTVSTHYLDVPGASIYYEVRGSGPLLALIGAPMGQLWFRRTRGIDGLAIHSPDL